MGGQARAMDQTLINFHVLSGDGSILYCAHVKVIIPDMLPLRGFSCRVGTFGCLLTH